MANGNSPSNADIQKRTAGKAAAALIKDGMIVGLGTGSTAAYFINSLIERVQQGLKITAVATSVASEALATAGGIPVVTIDEVSSIDITVDGADEIDPNKNLIKGGGGALLREKIVAAASKELVIIADDSKLVEALGSFPLPIEIIPFGYRQTCTKLEALGLKIIMRKTPEGALFVTDNHNYIADIHFDHLLTNPEKEHQALINVIGVVETGLFLNMARRIIIGKDGEHVEIRE